jgi:hypothetical protein
MTPYGLTKIGATIQTNREHRLITRTFRGVFWLVIALACLLLLGMLVQFLLRVIMLRNKALGAKLAKPYDAVILKMAGGPFSPTLSLPTSGGAQVESIRRLSAHRL